MLNTPERLDLIGSDTLGLAAGLDLPRLEPCRS